MAINFLSSIEIDGSCSVTSIDNDNNTYTGILVWDGQGLKYRTKAQLLADIGAGSGYHVFRMAPLAKNGLVYAVDIQPEMLEAIELKKKQKRCLTLRRFLDLRKVSIYPKTHLIKFY